MCEEIGYNFIHKKFEQTIEEQSLLSEIQKLNNDKNINAILVQMPIPNHLDIKQIQNKVSKDKDVDGLNDKNKSWAYTCCYYSFEYKGEEFSDISKAEALAMALDSFRGKTEENYISRNRLVELATSFKDGLLEDDKYSALEYFDGFCMMEEHEKEFFGIDDAENATWKCKVYYNTLCYLHEETGYDTKEEAMDAAILYINNTIVKWEGDGIQYDKELFDIKVEKEE